LVALGLKGDPHERFLCHGEENGSGSTCREVVSACREGRLNAYAEERLNAYAEERLSAYAEERLNTYAEEGTGCAYTEEGTGCAEGRVSGAADIRSHLDHGEGSGNGGCGLDDSARTPRAHDHGGKIQDEGSTSAHDGRIGKKGTALNEFGMKTCKSASICKAQMKS
jgi:hypothetical protein